MSGCAASANSAGVSPMSSAIACSYCARDADVDRLHLRTLQLRFCLHDVGARCDADVVLVLRQLQRLLIGGHGVVQQAFLSVGDAQLEIGLRERRVQRQARGLESRRACLRTGDIAIDRAPHAAPQVRLPGSGKRQLERVGRMRGTGAAGAGAAADHGTAGHDAAAGCAVSSRTRGAWTGGQRRPEACACARHQRGGLAILRLGLFQTLVGYIDLLFQIVERGVPENLPPRTTLDRIRGCGLLPAGVLLVDRRCRQRRFLVIGTDGTRRQQRAARGSDEKIQPSGSHVLHLYTFLFIRAHAAACGVEPGGA